MRAVWNSVAQTLFQRSSLAVENVRAYARANDASRLKDEFLATLSHELRTPLNAVLGYARMLREQSVPLEKVQPALDIVERNATALQQIIEDVLDVSRIVAGRVRLNVEPVDLPRILHDALATVTPAADAKGVRLESTIDPVTTLVSGDPDRLQQIDWNLLSKRSSSRQRAVRCNYDWRASTRMWKSPSVMVRDSVRLPAIRVRTLPPGRSVLLAAVDDEPDSLNLLRAVLEGAGAIVVTAYARSHDRISSLASGYQMHLVKPIDPVELVVAIAALAVRRSGDVRA